MLQECKHLFKLDPARPISDHAIERLCTSGTDGILIGGTDDVTFENSYELFCRVRKFHLPVLQEISSIESILPDCDGYRIPLVLNAQDPYWLLSAHKDAIKQFGKWIPWEKCQVEGYLILNEDCKAAKVTKAKTDLSLEDVIAYAQLADSLLKLPYLYVEYSGIYGNPAILQQVKNVLKHSRLIYGGGIDGTHKAREMLQFADTIIVGNCIYESIEQALATVIK